MKLKRWVIAVALVFSLAVGAFSLWYTNWSANELLGLMEQTRQALLRQEWGEAEEELRAMEQDWSKHKNMLQVFISHQDVDAVERALGKLSVGIQNRNLYEALYNAKDAEWAIEHLPAKETPSLPHIM